MIYTPRHCSLILTGRKTQTRRIRSSGDYAVRHGSVIIEVRNNPGQLHPGRLKYKVGWTYAAQPGRGKVALGRTLLLSIQEQSIQEITVEDVRAEGIIIHTQIPNFPQYDSPWTDEQMDKLMLVAAHLQFGNLWDSIHGEGAWDFNDTVWVLTFRVAVPSIDYKVRS